MKKNKAPLTPLFAISFTSEKNGINLHLTSNLDNVSLVDFSSVPYIDAEGFGDGIAKTKLLDVRDKEFLKRIFQSYIESFFVQKEVLNIRIKDLNLSPSIKFSLTNWANLSTVRGIMRKSKKDLLRVAGIGPIKLQEIEKCLYDLGLEL